MKVYIYCMDFESKTAKWNIFIILFFQRLARHPAHFNCRNVIWITVTLYTVITLHSFVIAFTLRRKKKIIS